MRRISLALCGLVLAGCATTPVSSEYYDMKQDGKTYVFGSVSSLQKFMQTRTMGESVVAYYKSQPVVFEANDAGIEYRLMADYEKQNK